MFQESGQGLCPAGLIAGSSHFETAASGGTGKLQSFLRYQLMPRMKINAALLVKDHCECGSTSCGVNIGVMIRPVSGA